MGNTQTKPIKCPKCKENPSTYRKQVSVDIVPCKCDLRCCKCYSGDFSNWKRRLDDNVDRKYKCKACGESIYPSDKNCICGWSERCNKYRDLIKSKKHDIGDFYYGIHGHNDNKMSDTVFKQFYYGCSECIVMDCLTKDFKYNHEGYNTHHWYK